MTSSENRAEQLQEMIAEVKRRRGRAIRNRRLVMMGWAMAGAVMLVAGERAAGVVAMGMAVTVRWMVWQYRRGA